MRDPQDIIDIEGLAAGQSFDPDRARAVQTRPWKMVWFRCCHVYGRMYRNISRTHYIGRCPRCAAEVSARIGPDGTNATMFEAR